MDKFEEKSKRDLLAGLRTAVRALEEEDGFILKIDGKLANKERAEELRRQIAYLADRIHDGGGLGVAEVA